MKQSTAVVEALAIGALAGLVGTFVMTRCQRALGEAIRDGESDPGRAAVGRHKVLGPSKAAALADNASKLIRGRNLEREIRPATGIFGHYGLGVALGAVYGLVASRFPEARAGLGLPFGFVIWLSADELLMPALRVTHPPFANPARAEAYSALAHAVYGVSTHLAERGLSEALRGGRPRE